VGFGEKAVPLPRIFFWNFKSKMAHFCALLCIDFKVCRLITETVDHIKKTDKSSMFLPFFRASKARTRNYYCDNGYKQHFFIGLHFITGLFNALQLIY